MFQSVHCKKNFGCGRSFGCPRPCGFGVLSVAVAVAFANQLVPMRPASAESGERPNVVLIMADDMGYSDLGCFGGEIRSPHLDRLAESGLRFTNFYSENMCWVSRAALLTSVYHKTSLSRGTLHRRCATLPAVLRDHGYQTRMSGKWHLAGNNNSVFPVDRGFEHFYGILGGAASFFAPHNLSRDRENIEHEYRDDPDYYLTYAISDNAVGYIDEANGDKPLFLYVAYTAAHWPLHAPAKAVAEYRGQYAGGWDSLREQRLARMKKLGVVQPATPLSSRHPNVPAWEDEEHQDWQQRRMEVYAAQVTLMDEGIGKIIAALKRSGRWENTLLVFMVDNGGCHVEYAPTRKGDYLPEETRDGRPVVPGNLPTIMPGPEETYQSYGYGWANASNTPFRLFKQFDHEGGIHTPMIAHWPRGIVRPGRLVKETAHLIDIMPTVLAAAGAKPPKTIAGAAPISFDGHSLLPALRAEPQTEHSTIFFHHAKGKAIRAGRWKLVQQTKGPWELYDLQADPNELNNLANAMPQKVGQLRKEWQDWQQQQVDRAKD